MQSVQVKAAGCQFPWTHYILDGRICVRYKEKSVGGPL